ncbi:luciferin sulfotransferase isoform X2 [Phlebotomus argentipes]|uniref:luciferin sulfotransferase isoform X2 n=1 Tax=Phlebotomus argentipes TaxID=94469 RepID=UPI002893270B|nr:luciferin sulfotransferase isoform X2 [Phlebotomus argentipes]
MAFNNNKGEFDFPFAIKEIDPDINQQLLRDFRGEKTGFVQVGEEKWFFPSQYSEMAQHFYNFQARQDDIWVATFPRSGTTWTQELVWMIANDLDYVAAQREPLTKRFPFFEFAMFLHPETKAELMQLNVDSPQRQAFVEEISVPAYKFLPHITGRRFIKTHFPFSLMPPSVLSSGAKIVYVARNPRDVLVSFYHLNRLYRSQGYIGDFATYCEYFEENLAPWMPYWSHIREGWENRNHPNVLFMFYEDMNRDLAATIRHVADFLGKSLTDAQVERLRQYLSIEEFRKNDAVNCTELKSIHLLNSGEQGFVRRGKSDGWSEEYTPELRERVTKWILKHSKELPFKFPCDLV